MLSWKPGLLVALCMVIPAVAIDGCASQDAAATFQRRLEACSIGERNGLLDAATEACGEALGIAEELEYPPPTVSGLLFRLGRLERQRGRFAEAESLIRRSLAIQGTSGEPAERAAALIELSLDLAGQGRWEMGASTLREVVPLAEALVDQDRELAANVFMAYGARLSALGMVDDAELFTSIAVQLKPS